MIAKEVATLADLRRGTLNEIVYGQIAHRPLHEIIKKSCGAEPRSFALVYSRMIADLAGQKAFISTGFLNDAITPFFLLGAEAMSSAATPYYDVLGSVSQSPEKHVKLKKVISDLPGELNRELLPLIVSSYNKWDLPEARNSIALITHLPLRSISSFVGKILHLDDSTIADFANFTDTNIKKLVKFHLKKEGYDDASIVRYISLLSHHQDRGLTRTKDLDLLAEIAARLANSNWQIAKLHDHNLRAAKGQITDPYKDPLTKSQFDTFENMINSAYQEYLHAGHPPQEAYALVIFKIFQDIAEYHTKTKSKC